MTTRTPATLTEVFVDVFSPLKRMSDLVTQHFPNHFQLIIHQSSCEWKLQTYSLRYWHHCKMNHKKYNAVHKFLTQLIWTILSQIIYKIRKVTHCSLTCGASDTFSFQITEFATEKHRFNQNFLNIACSYISSDVDVHIFSRCITFCKSPRYLHH